LEDVKEIGASTRQVLKIQFSTSLLVKTSDEPGNESMIPELVNMITQELAHWEAATVFPGAIHSLEFGPGAYSGLVF